jgi:periplasmic protein TonB
MRPDDEFSQLDAAQSQSRQTERSSMFEDSLLEKNRTIQSRRKSATLVSLIIEAVVIGVVIIIPLIVTQALPTPKLTTMLVAPPPPPPPPPAPAATKIKTTATTTTSTTPVVKVNKTALDDLRTPTKIPKKIDMTPEAATAAAPAPSMGGVAGGVPGGVQGGAAGGVLGGILNSGTAMPVKPKMVRVSQGISEGLLVKKVTPQYPTIAKQARVQGSVQLKAIIGKDGKVENVQPESGNPLLASAAVNAVKQWRYKPYVLDGNPVEVETTVTVNFRLTV